MSGTWIEFLVDLMAVADGAALPELVAMVGDDDEDGVRELAFDGADEAGDLIIIAVGHSAS
jgi:hypothetical protein